jgi:hypothetical protein
MQLKVFDTQNESDTGKVINLPRYLGIKGEYLPKKVTDTPAFNDILAVTKNKSVK